MRKVLFQPDYFMSPQFAGLAVALRTGRYARRGIELDILPLGGAGERAEEVSIVARAKADSPLLVGSTEQYILTQALRDGTPGESGVRAVAAMFGRSPLALAALPGRELTGLTQAAAEELRVGVHEDTVGLVSRLLPSAVVVPVGRDDKMELLRSGQIDAAQVYDVTETLKMEADLGAAPALLPLEGLGGARLGYAQVLFAAHAQLREQDQVATLQDFLAATFDGWAAAKSDPRAAADAVMALMANQPAPSDHWDHSLPFHQASVERCWDYVRRARCAGKLGAIDGRRWAEATEWLGGSGGVQSLDPAVWASDPLLGDGDSLAASILDKVAAKAAAVRSERGQPPRLGLVTVGELAEGHTSAGASSREAIAPAGQSWFNKAAAGEKHGVLVEQLDLPYSTATPDLLAALAALSRRCDGIQLMWPLPAHVDAVAAYGAVPPHLDVDGAHFVSRSEYNGGSCVGRTSRDPRPGLRGCLPVTPEAVLQLLQQRGVALAGSHALVIGRSRIVGSPLAAALLAADATVSVAHSRTKGLGSLCRSADVIVSCAGYPGLVRGAWVKDGAAVVSVGTTFAGERFLSDLEEDLEAFRHAGLVVTSPGGVGPLSLALLLRNVADSAARRASDGAVGGADERTPPASAAAVDAFLRANKHWAMLPKRGDGPGPSAQRALVREVRVPSHRAAADLLDAAAELGDRLDHHVALSAVEHRCEAGVQLTLHAYTTSTGDVTAHDLALAAEIEQLCERPFVRQQL